MESHSSDVCLNESIEDINSFLDVELETLQSIFINELEVKADQYSTTVSIDLHPATADKLDEQYVRMTLELILEDEYPEKVPEIKIRNPRGLSEEKINSIVKDLLTIAENKKGNSMLFEMIDAAKEHLTVGNRPSGECAICLYRFSENDVFTKTECYHYFHSHCLARYTKNFIENSEDYENDAKSKSISNELLCPMCRIPIQFSGSDCDYPPPEESDESSFTLTEQIVELQRKMADLYKKQVEKGGIIDVEAEKNKYLLEISTVPTRSSNDESSEQKFPVDNEFVSESKVESSDLVDSPRNDRKEHVKDRYQRYDSRGKNRNYNRQNERGKYRYDQKYNRQSYDNYRGNYNRNNYVKNHPASSRRYSEETDHSYDGVKATNSWDAAVSEDASNSQDVHDDVSETSDQPSGDVRSKHTSDSPRYNRGYRRGNNYGNNERNNYGNYSSRYGNRRYDKSNFHESHNPHTSHRYSSMRNEELSTGNSEERSEKDQTVCEDSGENSKPNYRSDNYRHGDNFSSRERYTNKYPQRGGRGAYVRRDNYSNSHNNYSRNRYTDRDQYLSERDNYKGRRNDRDDRDRFRNSDEKSYYDSNNRQSSRNYSTNRRGKYADKPNSESTSNEHCEFSQIQSEDLNNTSKSQLVKTESSSKKYFSSFERENKSSQSKEVSHCDEKLPVKSTDAKASQDGNGLTAFPTNVFTENTQVRSRTVNPPPGFANPLKKVIYGLQGANPPPGFNRS